MLMKNISKKITCLKSIVQPLKINSSYLLSKCCINNIIVSTLIYQSQFHTLKVIYNSNNDTSITYKDKIQLQSSLQKELDNLIQSIDSNVETTVIETQVQTIQDQLLYHELHHGPYSINYYEQLSGLLKRIKLNKKVMLNLIHQLQIKKIPLNLFLFNEQIYYNIIDNNWEDIKKLEDKLKYTNVNRDNNTLDLMIKKEINYFNYLKEIDYGNEKGNIKEMNDNIQEWLVLFENKKITLSEKSWLQLLQFYLKLGEYELAEKVYLMLLKKENGQIEENVSQIIFNNNNKELMEDNKDNNIIELLNESKNINPFIIRLGIKLYSKLKKKQLIQVLFNKINNKNEKDYISLTTILLQNQEFQLIEDYFQLYLKQHLGFSIDLKDENSIIDINNKKDDFKINNNLIFNLYLKSLLIQNKKQEIENLVNLMKQFNLMDLISYTTLIKSYTQKEEIIKVNKIFNEIEQSNLQLDTKIILIYSELLFLHGEYNEAYQLIEKYNNSLNLLNDINIIINLCYGSIINFKENKAAQYYSILKNKKIHIEKRILLLQASIQNEWHEFLQIIISDIGENEYNSKLYTILLNYYSRNQKKLEYLLLYQKLKLDNNLINLDIYLINSLINGFNLLKLPFRSLQQFDMLESMNLKPNEATLSIILDTTSHHQLPERFESIWNKYSNNNNNKDIQLNSNHYSNYLEGLARLGYIEEAIQFLYQNSSKIEFNLKTYSILIQYCKKFNLIHDKLMLIKTFLLDQFPQHRNQILKLFF